ATFGRHLAALHQLAVDVRVGTGVDTLAGQEAGVAGLGDRDPPQHLTHDELDVLVVNRHALVPVHLLDLVDQVLLGLADALDLQQLLGILGTLDQGVAGGDLLALGDEHAAEVAGGDRVALLGAVVADDGDRAALGLVVGDADDAGRAGQDRLALGRAGLEELDDARQTVGDVLTGDTTGVERPHGELRARLADGLGGDDAD